MPATLEIVCDESGFAGGNLVGPGNSPVFAHASLTIGAERAAGLISALRNADRPRPGEFKASRLRQAQQAAAAEWLLSQAELRADHALLHLTDTRFFVLARTVDALLGDQSVRSIDSPGATPALHRTAGALYRASRRSGEAEHWDRFLVSAANLLRTHNRWLPPDPLPRFAAAVESVLATGPEPEAAAVLARLRAAGGRAAEVRAALEQDRRSASLMEPLLPALMRAIAAWGARTDSLTVIHDEQSALTPWRIAEMGARLASAGGRLSPCSASTPGTIPGSRWRTCWPGWAAAGPPPRSPAGAMPTIPATSRRAISSSAPGCSRSSTPDRCGSRPSPSDP